MTSLFESKWRTLLKYGGWYGCVNFVETGTGQGDTLDILYPFFRRCHSVELSPDLFRAAKAKFQNVESITLHQGDSGEELKSIVPIMRATTLYYLDAHYSGLGTAQGGVDTPIIAELNAILKPPKFNGVIIIDDLKNFTGRDGYPTPAQIKAALPDGLNFEIISDGGGMMVITPTKSKPDLKRKLIQVVPKVVTGNILAVPEAKPTPPDQPRNFERPPILYGPYRNPEK